MTAAPSPDPVSETIAAGVAAVRPAGMPGSSAFYPLLAVAYALTGRLGLLLAVPPGYASAIFPPAGIAAAAMLTAGPASLPWVFLGSLLLNIAVGYEAGAASPAASLAALLIAAASTVQAALLGTALKRALGYPTALDDGRQVWRFLLLAPLCCLTSATLSVGGLWGLGVVTRGGLASSWLSWWVGDTLGVLVVLPLMLVLFGEPRELWRARLYPVALPMLLFFALFVVIFIRVSAWEAEAQLLEFRLVSQRALDKIRTILDEQEVFLNQLERTFSQAAPVDRAEFRRLVERTLERFPMVQAIAWAPRVGADARVAFEAAQRAEIPQFEIRDIGPEGGKLRAARRAELYPIAYIEPIEANEAALGLDLAFQIDPDAALARALRSGKVSAAGPIRLPSQSSRQPVMLLAMPVSQGGSGPGVVLVALRVGALVENMLAGMGSVLHLRLIDATGHVPLHDDFVATTDVAHYRQEFDFGLRHFVIESEPTSLYLARTQGWQSWALLSAGVLGIGLLGALLLLGTGYAHRIETQVAERTADLAEANRRLRVEIEERQHAEAALRQAQRMEAIGRLTGGIAHDFNNLLTVVTANAELFGKEAAGQPAQRRAAAILRAAERGERLTRQLLSFSRRQNLRPETVDLRARAGELAELLARALPAEIAIGFALPDDLWPVKIDPAEFELAVLNIAVNARDAMPNGGRFAVSAKNIASIPAGKIGIGPIAARPGGDFIALAFADTGCGMPSDVLAHAFDPYFTTKDVGVGSGLGLSQVYGFATQSGGDAALASEVGSGTTVTLLLPRATDAKPDMPAA